MSAATPQAGAFSIETRDVTKSFGAVRALAGADFKVGAGEARGLVGENGAGKSTLINVISGALRPDRGEFLLAGEPTVLRDPHAALSLGISTVHQQNQLVHNLTVMENVQLGDEPTRTPLGVMKRRPREGSMTALDFVGLAGIAGREAGSLTYAERQLVSIARALAHESRLVIFDEPTAALSPLETESLFEVIARLREHGTSIVYVTHRLEELPLVVERVTVMRDGKIVAERPATAPERELIKLMAGEEFIAEEERIVAGHRRDLVEVDSDQPALTVEGMVDIEGRYSDISFELRRGEVLGLVGLPDSGVVELTQAIAGARPIRAGERTIAGKEVHFRSPRGALANGLGYLAGDRALNGVIPNLSVRENVTLSALTNLSTAGVFSPRRERALAKEMASRCEVRAGGLGLPITALSGGNQQKALLARLLATSPPVLVCEDPTAGVDVAGRESIYELVTSWCRSGNAVLWNSTDLREVVTICDRVLVFWKGAVKAELRRADIQVPSLMEAQFNQRADGERRSWP